MNDGKSKKQSLRDEAKERDLAYAKLTLAEKLAKLDSMPGLATKQRAKLALLQSKGVK